MVTVNEIFAKVGLKPSVAIKWGQPIPSSGNGVYVISTSSNPSQNLGIESTCRISKEVFNQWKLFSPNLNVEDDSNLMSMEKELNRFWKPNENILYIGESSSKTNGLAKRIKQYYIHKVGWKGPHTGGYWLKLFSLLDDLYVYYAECNNPRDVEFKMLMYFIEGSTGKSFYDIEELGKCLPFANLKVDFQKKHAIKNAVTK